MKTYLAIGLCLVSFSAQGALHKWVDAKGVVHYSDTVPSSDIKAQTLRSRNANEAAAPASGVAAPKSFAEQQAEQKKADQAKAQAAEKTAREQENAEIKRKNCDNARISLSTLENAPRLVTYDAQGERSYLDDDTRQQRIEEARKAVSSNCN
ncbi:MAG TPA: DUF4124 domain-containing protein [Gallionellaceae bacterium]